MYQDFIFLAVIISMQAGFVNFVPNLVRVKIDVFDPSSNGRTGGFESLNLSSNLRGSVRSINKDLSTHANPEPCRKRVYTSFVSVAQW